MLIAFEGDAVRMHELECPVTMRETPENWVSDD